ncbi:MAG: rhodanese-like domain-containing protein [Polyangiaceae bacterium]|nr:rhodanese-like domain-containing protein [Polyangiaceae bacterium]
MPPAELAARLADVAEGKIAVLMVGPRQLWRQERVPGSRWIGEAQKSEGLAALETALSELGPEVEVVAYCGCCPYAHCPNLRPARRVLAARANARFLDLPTSFRVDWIDKGHPIDKGREPG